MEEENKQEYLRLINHLCCIYEGVECWSAIELNVLLNYRSCKRFDEVIEKAKADCKREGIEVSDHFANYTKLLNLSNNKQRKIDDIALTGYACYLVAQNLDSDESKVELAEFYFMSKFCRYKDIKQIVMEEGKVPERKKYARRKTKPFIIVYGKKENDKGFGIIRNKKKTASLGEFTSNDMKRKTEKFPIIFSTSDYKS